MAYSQARTQSKIARNNATAAEYQAQDAGRRGEIERDRLRMRTMATMGKARAGFGASGIALGSGSPLDVELDLAEAGAQDLELAQHNTALEMWGFRAQRSNYIAQSRLYEQQSTNSLLSGSLGATSSLIGGAYQIASTR